MPEKTKKREPSRGKPKDGAKQNSRARLSPDERRKDFVDKAIKLFSEVGFDGGTRNLAQSLGVTQPLLYRYFPSKNDLINEVFDTVYVRRWNDEWGDIIIDRSKGLKERLTLFYHSYTESIFTREWMRIFFFAGLKGMDLNRSYVRLVQERVLRPLCFEVRHDLGFDERAPLHGEEIDLAWSMHGGIFYRGVRSFIYQIEDDIEKDFTIDTSIDMYLEMVPRILERLVPRV